MAFMKYAAASVVQRDVGPRGWARVRTASSKGPSRDLIAQATEILGEPFNPDRYLLTHCTIVASVDVEPVSGVKLGKLRKGNQKIYRKYADYHISPETAQFVNNNGDCWSRETLLKSFHTFIGSHNFQEHVQIEELSKGRIVDAVARDIGDSVYIDILVATDRKHKQLVADIESGKMGTLSMGCSVDFTICSKCGNVAVDETEMCDHIRYHKRNTFYDESGKRRIVAELCGHPSIEPTGGVTFIEASWVETPAFTGAVLRNVLNAEEVSTKTAAKIQEILAQPPRKWVDEGSPRKVASLALSEEAIVRAVRAALGREGFDFDEPAEDAAPAEEKAPFDELEDEIEQAVVDKVKDNLKQQIRKDDAAESADIPSPTAPNDSVIKEARYRVAYNKAVAKVVRTASSDAALINGIAELDAAFGLGVSRGLYRASLRVGASNTYPTLRSYLDACTQALGRPATPKEAKKMLFLGKFLSVLDNPSK